jgi:hypothetical protein
VFGENVGDILHMPARTIDLDTIPYRVFVNKEQGRYRGFWFCPHPDCLGAHCSARNSDTPEDAIEIAAEAARVHEAEKHAAQPIEDLCPETQEPFPVFALKFQN